MTHVARVPTRPGRCHHSRFHTCSSAWCSPNSSIGHRQSWPVIHTIVTDAPILLASASPRRSALLAQVGIAHVVEAANVDEAQLDGEAAADYVLRIASAKARTVAARHPADRV